MRSRAETLAENLLVRERTYYREDCRSNPGEKKSTAACGQKERRKAGEGEQERERERREEEVAEEEKEEKEEKDRERGKE